MPYVTTSNPSGNFTLEQLVPGRYRITATKAGFGNIRRSGITLNAGDSLVQNFSMRPGSVEQLVTVTSATPLISSDQATLSTVLDNKLITELGQIPTKVRKLSQDLGYPLDEQGVVGDSQLPLSRLV